MKAARAIYAALHRLSHPKPAPAAPPPPPKIGLALGGGFARGIAHAGVLEVFERHHIPIHCITGVSAGSIAAAAYASGATPAEIARAACAMRFGDVARWTLCRTGFVGSERMERFRAAQFHIGQLRLDRMQLRGGLRHVQIRSCAALPQVLRQIQRTPVGSDRVSNQIVLIIQRAQGEVIVGHFGRHVQFCGFPVISTGSVARVRGLRKAADAPP